MQRTTCCAGRGAGVSVMGILAAWLLASGIVAPGFGAAQEERAGAQPQAARESALVDLTGYWVSVVTEDWKYRMLAMPRGDYERVPLNAKGREVALAWDPAADETTGDQCKAYGAAGIMRIPTRLHATWQDENTLKIETDAGRQTRLLHFRRSPPAGGKRQRQGYSAASWEREGPGGTLKVVTTQMLPGYLRLNGVPYSGNTVLTEYFDRHASHNGDEWITVTTIVSDPTYLSRDYITSTDFKKEPDGSKWNPTPCETLLGLKWRAEGSQ